MSKPEKLADTLRAIVWAGDSACITGTPMVPLHKDTVADILAQLERVAQFESAAQFFYEQSQRIKEESDG